VIDNARIHHIGFLTRNLKTEADRLTVLGYEVASDVIEDPVQTAFVQFLKQPHGNLWLELITPNGPESKLSLGLRKGGGINHVCYEVPDIEGACEALRLRNFVCLCRPTPAVAFPGRNIAWFVNAGNFLVELVEAGEGPLSLAELERL
jgi:methylmalonyl-CoA/ethylmalonyl-CoA epimerase